MNVCKTERDTLKTLENSSKLSLKNLADGGTIPNNENYVSDYHLFFQKDIEVQCYDA